MWLFALKLALLAFAVLVALRIYGLDLIGHDDADDPRTPLSLRHDAARRRADDGRRLLARGQARSRGACSTGSASTTSRAAIPAPTRSTRSSSPRSARQAREVHRLRHDQAGRALGLQRSRHRRAARGARPTRSASSPRPGTIMCAWRSASRSRRTSRASATASRRRAAAGREVMLDCEHFFDGYKANPRLRARLRHAPPTRPARAGSCCATPMAARCRTRSSAIVARGRAASCPAIAARHPRP